MKKLILWICLLFASPPLWAVTRYVNPACTNNITTYNAATKACTGGAARVYSSIANMWAGGLFAAGDTTIVETGTYTSGIPCATTVPNGTSFADAAVLRPATGATVTVTAQFCFDNTEHHFIVGATDGNWILDGTGKGDDGIFIWAAAHHLRFINIEVRNWKNASTTTAGVHISDAAGAGHEFKFMKVHDNGVDQLDHGIYNHVADVLVEDSIVYRNSGYGIQFYSNGSSAPSNGIIRRNTLFDNGTGGYGGGIVISRGSNIQVYNNVTYATTASQDSGIEVDFQNVSGGKVYNNTVYGHPRGIVIGSGSSSAVVRNNIVVNNTTNIVNTGTGTSFTNNFCNAATTGCMTTAFGNPQFVNAAAADFRLLISSPAREKGADLSAVFTTDFSGLTRTVPWDTGAYKYVDFAAPTVSMTGPSNGATVSGNSVAVMANATDNVGVVGVQFKLDGSNLGTEDTSTPYGVTWDSTLSSNSVHVLTAVARDAAGNSATSAAISVTVDNAGAPDAAPTVSINSPLNGATVSGTITVSALATDDVSVSGVQFKLDGVNLGAEDTTFPYGVSWGTPSAGDGAHTLLAVARDGAGHTTTSTAVIVMVNNPPPTISGISAGSITSSTATIAWTTSTLSDTAVRYGFTGTYTNYVTTGNSVTSHSKALSGLSAFSLYHYRVESRDAIGQLSVSGDNTFTTLAAGATTITVTSPAGGETWVKDSVQTITWTKSSDVMGNVRVLISRNGGSTYRTIVNSVAASTGTTPWTVKPPSCNNCLIRVQSLTAPAVFDNSATFRITNN